MGVALLYSVLDYESIGERCRSGGSGVLQAIAFLVAVLSGLTVLLFPDGTLPSRRWRWVLWAYLASCAMFVAYQITDQVAAAAVRPLRVGLTGGPLSQPNLTGVVGAGRGHQPERRVADPGVLAGLRGPSGRGSGARRVCGASG